MRRQLIASMSIICEVMTRALRPCRTTDSTAWSFVVWKMCGVRVRWCTVQNSVGEQQIKGPPHSFIWVCAILSLSLPLSLSSKCILEFYTNLGCERGSNACITKLGGLNRTKDVKQGDECYYVYHSSYRIRSPQHMHTHREHAGGCYSVRHKKEGKRNREKVWWEKGDEKENKRMRMRMRMREREKEKERNYYVIFEWN